MHIKLIDTGEVQTVPEPEELKGRGTLWEIGPWHPDSTRFFANAHSAGWDQEGPSLQGTSIWAVLMMGGPPRKIRDDAEVYSVSPDGSSVAFGTKNGKRRARATEIWLMGLGGEQAHKLYDAETDESLSGFWWFRDGQRVAYGRNSPSGNGLVSRNLKGGPITTMLPSKMVDQTTTDRINSTAWSPDGRFIYTLPEPEPDNATGSSSNFWELLIDPRTGEPIGKPRRLTNWAGFGRLPRPRSRRASACHSSNGLAEPPSIWRLSRRAGRQSAARSTSL